jgi:hypothetical protein
VPSSPQIITTRGVFDYLESTTGKPIIGATINCTLNFNGASVTSPIVNVAELQQSTTTDSNGFWRFSLIPNDTLTPTGTLYTIQTPVSSYDISVPSGGADVQSSSILANTPSVLSPALTNLTGPITVTGNESVTGTLGVTGATTLGQLTAGATTLGASTVGGDLTIGSAFRLLFGAAVAKIIPGATSISHRNNADSADNLLITDAGAVTVRNGLTVTAGDGILTAGRLLISSAAAKILGGVTSLSLRNNADNADNLLVADAGAITARGIITANDFSASGATGGQLPLRLFGGGTTVVTALPALAATKFLIQGGSTIAVTAGNLATITYPTAFPTGVLTVVATPGDASGVSFAQIQLVQTSATLSVFVAGCFNNTGTAIANASSVRINWMAIGW